MTRLKQQIEADARKIMTSLSGNKVQTFTTKRLAMQSDQSTEDMSKMFKEVTEGEAEDNIHMTQQKPKFRVGEKVIDEDYGVVEIVSYGSFEDEMNTYRVKVKGDGTQSWNRSNGVWTYESSLRKK